MSREKMAETLPNQHHQFIRIKDVMHQTGLSRSSLYVLASQGKFPRGVSLVPGGASIGWVAQEVNLWCEERIAQRDQEAS
jgi:prophage regulatory protein